MSDSRSVMVCGGDIVGLRAAHYLARAGFAVTRLERNAGYISPSHLAPIAAPGMVWQGLKWMLSSRSPFYIQPRLDPELIRWGRLFARSCAVVDQNSASSSAMRFLRGAIRTSISSAE